MQNILIQMGSTILGQQFFSSYSVKTTITMVCKALKMGRVPAKCFICIILPISTTILGEVRVLLLCALYRQRHWGTWKFYRDMCAFTSIKNTRLNNWLGATLKVSGRTKTRSPGALIALPLSPEWEPWAEPPGLPASDFCGCSTQSDFKEYLSDQSEEEIHHSQHTMTAW